MKVDKPFLMIYDVTFDWILKHQGLDALINYWKRIAPIILSDLKGLVEKKGIVGCFEYWNSTLKAEGAKFDINLSSDEKFKLRIRECPSIKILNNPNCKEYCRHCKVLYAEILEPLGYKYIHRQVGQGRCEIEIERG